MKKIFCCELVLMVGALLAAGPALAADRSGLSARAATWEKEYNAGNFAAVVALYAPDGCRMPPNQKIAQGSDAIMAQLKAGKDAGAAKVKVSVTGAETNGSIGYGMGTYETMGADGNTLDRGKWMNTSRKMNAKWITQCDIFNSDMPLPSMK